MPSDVELELEVIQTFEKALLNFAREVKACARASMYRGEELQEFLSDLADLVPDQSEWKYVAKHGGRDD